MFDAIHFTYYWVPCSYTFPEMARLVAQLGFQHAVGRPVEVRHHKDARPVTPSRSPSPSPCCRHRPSQVCPPNTPASDEGVAAATSDDGGASSSAGLTTRRLHLGQDPESTAHAYAAALRLGGRAAQGLAASDGKGKGKGKAGSRGASTSEPPADAGLLDEVGKLAAEYGGRKRGAALAGAIKQLLAKHGVQG